MLKKFAMYMGCSGIGCGGVGVVCIMGCGLIDGV